MTNKRKKFKIWKLLLAIVLAVVLFVIGFVAYIELSYFRIGDTELSAEGSGISDAMAAGTTYTISTYNMGFGAYQQDYTCVLDTAFVPDENGEWVLQQGVKLCALSKDDALANTRGAVSTIAALDPDIALFQEIDTDSHRCYRINQTEIAKEALSKKASVFCINLHTPFVPYPINDMMGDAESGVMTFSDFKIQSAERHEFEVTADLFDRLFDLDRCFSASYIDVDNGKQLVLINLHMSAYDEGGIIREAQRKQLYSFIQQEYEKGNYVIAGGDFNHDLLTENPDYPEYTAETPAFSESFTYSKPTQVVYFFDENGEAGLPEGFRVIASDNHPTCRGASAVWDPVEDHVFTLDGFIVSPNVTVVDHWNITTATDSLEGFAYSDHEPAVMQFSLED